MTIEQTIRKIETFRLGIPEVVAGEVIRQVREFAASGKNPDGSDWKPYTAAYLAWRKSKGLPTSPVTKRVTGQFLMSVKNRNMVIAPSDDQMAKAEGLERKRKSFQVSPITPVSIIRILENKFNELFS